MNSEQIVADRWTVRLRPKTQGQPFASPAAATATAFVGEKQFTTIVSVADERLTDEFCRPLLARQFAAGVYVEGENPTEMFGTTGPPDGRGVYHTRIVAIGRTPGVKTSVVVPDRCDLEGGRS